jgi:nitrate/nitrite transporter NarK
MGLINMLGALGGFFGPLIAGAVSQQTGNFAEAFMLLSTALIASAILSWFLKEGALPSQKVPADD